MNAFRALLTSAPLCVACVVLLSFSAPVQQSAMAAPPSIESVTPPVAQRGTELEVRIAGSNLKDTTSIVFYSPELVCKTVRAESDYELLAVVAISDKCSVGNVPFRILSPHGFSELRTLRVSPLPVLYESKLRESADSPTIAIEKLNVTVNGTLESGDADRFAVDLKAGQRLTVEVEAVRLGYGLLDTILAVFGPDEQELATSDDTALFQQDPYLSFEAPMAGRYVVEVHESNYRGTDTSFYALHIGSFPSPAVAYPPGGQLGTTVDVQMLASKLPKTQNRVGAGEGEANSIVRVEIPQDGSDFRFLLSGPWGTNPTCTPFRVSPFANVLESEPNDDRKVFEGVASSSSSVPVAFNGILQSNNDVDCFPFEAAKGQFLRAEAFAVRIGSPVDSLISIFGPDGRLIGRNDDWGSHDSRLDFAVTQSGVHVLQVTDKLGAGSSNAAYRVEVVQQQPALTAFLPRPERKSQKQQTVAVPQGNRSAVRVGVRRELVNGAVELVFDNLPSGVHASPVIVAEDQFWCLAILEAQPEAEIQGSLCGISVACENEFGRVTGKFEQMVDLVSESADQLFQAANLDRVAVAVTKPIPFAVELQPPSTALPAGGTLEMKIEVERRDGFMEPIRVEFPFLPPWVVGEPFVVIPSDQSSFSYRFEARAEAATRTWPIVAVARIDTLSASGETEAYDGREVASQQVDLEIGAPPISGQFVDLASEQNTSLNAVCKLTLKGELPDRLMATLEGLPNRVTADSPEWKAGMVQVEFKINIPDDAPVGKFPSVQCRLSGQLDGQQVSFVVAADSVLQIETPGKLKRGASGQVLSPLDALRVKKLK